MLATDKAGNEAALARRMGIMYILWNDHSWASYRGFAKADLVRRTLFGALGGEERFQAVDVRLVRSDKADADWNDEATALLRVSVKDSDPKKVGRAFANAAVEMAVANYPGFFCTSPPTAETPFGVYWPALVPVGTIAEEVVLGSCRTVHVAIVAPTGDQTLVIQPCLSSARPYWMSTSAWRISCATSEISA